MSGKNIIAQTISTDQLNEMVDVNSVTPWDPVWALVSIIIGVIVGRIVRRLIRRYGASIDLPPNIVDLFGTVALWTVIAFSIVVALTFLGFTAAPLLIFGGIVIIVLVIGGRPLLESFGAGVLLQARAPFEPGDEVTVDEYTGVVVEVNSRVVVVRTIDNRLVFLPNTEVLQNAIVNLTHDDYRMGEVVVDVAYGSDLETALDAIHDAVTAQPEILDDPAPTSEVRMFAASGITLRVRYAHKPDVLSEWAATNAAAIAVHQGLKQAGITIPFPQRTLWWGDGEKPGPRDEGDVSELPRVQDGEPTAD
ncbi:MAG: mechanosensitive ion channel family protein [Acidimicrobiia bacterium]|nr:mechanosensitive ion channel family protein [Acidimicrobiia bacterium]